jgi:membrane protein
MNRKEFVKITKIAFHRWQVNNATIRAAALAFFTILPLPSLLLVMIGFFTFIYGQAGATSQLIHQVNIIAGPTIAGLVNELLSGGATNPLTSNVASALTIAFAAVGAIGAFTVIQDSINGIWEIKPNKHCTIRAKIRGRILPFLSVSIAAIVVVAWTGSTNVLLLSISYLFGNQASVVLGAIQVWLSFALTAMLFAIIYKMLPDTKVEWHDVWLAALLTSMVSVALNYLFGIYIHIFPATSLAGSAGSVMILMLWIFVSNEFILFGAQFSKTYAETVGSRYKTRQDIRNLQKMNSAKNSAELSGQDREDERLMEP